MYNKLFTSASIGLLSRICSIALRFVSLPLTLAVISKERYGLWLIILSLVGWLGMSDLGVPSALQNRLIYLRASGNKVRSHNLLSFALRLLISIGLVILLLISILTIILPLSKWFSIAADLEVEFKTALILCVLSFTIGLPTRIGGVIYNVHNQLAIQPLIEIGSNIVSLSLLYIAVKLQWNSLITLSGLSIAGLFAGSLLATILAFWRFGYRLFTPAANYEDKKVLLSKGSFFFLTMIGELLILQSDAILIGSILGANFVPNYLIPATLFINFLQLQNIWLRPLWPVLTNLHAKGDYTMLLLHIRNTILGSLLIAIVFGLGVILFGNWFIRLWSHNTVGMTSIMAWGFAAYILLACIDNLLSTILNSLNKIEFRFIYTLIFGLVKVTVGYIILSKGKSYIEWLPLGYAVSMLLTSLPMAFRSLYKTIPNLKFVLFLND